MPLEVESTSALFADDAYLYRSINSQDDTIRLQKDLDNLVEVVHEISLGQMSTVKSYKQKKDHQTKLQHSWSKTSTC